MRPLLLEREELLFLMRPELLLLLRLLELDDAAGGGDEDLLLEALEGAGLEERVLVGVAERVRVGEGLMSACELALGAMLFAPEVYYVAPSGCEMSLLGSCGY